MSENKKTYKTIGEVAKILDLFDRKTGKPATYTIRFWEKEFKQIKPKILNGNRRYFDAKTIDLLKKIKFLLKDQGMTINGVKKILNFNKPLKLDEFSNDSIKAFKIKNKVLKLSKIIKEIKKIK